MRNLCLLLICFSLTACVAGTGTSSKYRAPIPAGVVLSFPQLRAELAKIPGIQVAVGEPLVASFPAGVLFAQGSVLPMPGGTEPLDALSTLVKRSGKSWAIKLRADSDEGQLYDAQLVSKRVKLIKTYFKSSGVNLRKLSITAVAEAGASLELRPIQ